MAVSLNAGVRIDWTPPNMCSGFFGALLGHDWYPLHPRVGRHFEQSRCARCGVVYPQELTPTPPLTAEEK